VNRGAVVVNAVVFNIVVVVVVVVVNTGTYLKYGFRFFFAKEQNLKHLSKSAFQI
jgi:hypothetical protein